MQTYSLYWFKLGKNWDTVYKIPFSMKLDLASPPYLLPGLLMQNRTNFQDGGCQNFPTLGVDPSLVLHSVVKVPWVARTPPPPLRGKTMIGALMHISMFISRRRPHVWNERDVLCTKAAPGAQIGAQFMVLLNNPSLQSRSLSLRSSGRNARLWDSLLPEAKNPG